MRAAVAAALTTLAMPALVAIVLVAVAGPTPVAAHAEIESSVPGRGEVLATSPGTVQVTYTERVAPDQSDLRVLDVNGDRVDLDDARLIEGDPKTMRVGVRDDLPDGAYTVQWSNLSAVDGHSLSGTFVFFIGSDEFAAIEADEAPPEEGLPVIEPLARWATLAGLVLLAGVPFSFGLVLAGPAGTEESRALRPLLRRIAAAGGALVLVAGLVQLAHTVEGMSDAESLITGTRWGNGWALRMSLAALATLGYAAGPRLPRAAARWLPFVAIGAALAVSLTSHSASSEDIALVAGVVDASHILATVAWGGGLVAFLVLVGRVRSRRTESQVLSGAIARFSVLGALATVTLALTGTYAAWVHAGSLDAIATTYGRGVALKALLLLTLIGVAAVNTTRVRRRVSTPREVEAGARWLRRLLALEVALIVVILGVSGLITSIEPARQERIAESRAAGVVTETEDAGLTIRSTIGPGAVGPNRVTVELLRRGERYEEATGVQLRYTHLEAALTPTTAELERDENGTWSLAQPAILSVDGIYEFSIRVQWPGGLDARQEVRLETGTDHAEGLLDVSRAWWIGILVLAGVGAAMVAVNVVASRRRVIRSETLGWLGAGLAAAALLLWGRGPEGALFPTNPVPATEASLARGEELYVANCLRCHGAEFHGDGPDAGTLPVRPADLVLHFPQHPDGQHFAVITNGRPQSGMPAWEGALTEEEIWHIINYLRNETAALAPTLQTP